jgi:uncharacterized delta-60 repeat protein
MYRNCNRLFGLLIATSVIMSNPAAAGQTGFGENGLVTIDVPGFPDVNGVDIAIDHLDRIVVSGAVGDFFALFNTQEVAVARLLPDGSLDATFDDDGRAVTAFGGSSIHHRGGLAIDDLNRISIAAWTVNVSPGALDFGVARFTSDGTLDLAFDVDGHLTIAFPDADSHPDDLALAANGDAIVVGSVNPEDGPEMGGLARLDSAGALDGGFGAGGLVVTDFPTHEMLTGWRGIAIDADQRIVTGGAAMDPRIAAAARYLPDGNLDASFGDAGRVLVDFGQLSEFNAVALDHEGRIVLAGCVLVPGFSTRGFAVARLDENGLPDPAFGTDGLVVTPFDGLEEDEPGGCAMAVKVDAKGRIVAAGFAPDLNIPGQSGYAVVRYLADGSPDPTFGNGGEVFTTFPGQGHSQAGGVATDAQGRILVSGAVRVGEDNFIGVACYNEYGFACRELPFEYAAKVVCGVPEESRAGPVARGSYATTVNIHNPGTQPANFFKKMAFTRPPDEQRPGEVRPIAEDMLRYDEALAVDCPDLWRRLFDIDPPGRFFEGFVIIQSAASLDVTAVYTTTAVDENGRPTVHSSIDVERIEERIPPRDLNVTKAAEVLEFPFGDRLLFHAVLYTVTVANPGEQPALDVAIADELVLETADTVGVSAILEAPIDVPPGVQAGTPASTPPSSSIDFDVGLLSGGDEVTVRFWGVALNYIIGDMPSALLRDTATVSVGAGGPGGDSVTIETTLIP